MCICVQSSVHFGATPNFPWTDVHGVAGPAASTCRNIRLKSHKVPRPRAFSWQAVSALNLRWARMGPIIGHFCASCSGSIRNTVTNR